MVVRILDRFLMYYIRTADKLMRTARWLENMEGGIEVSTDPPNEVSPVAQGLVLPETTKSRPGRRFRNLF